MVTLLQGTKACAVDATQKESKKLNHCHGQHLQAAASRVGWSSPQSSPVPPMKCCNTCIAFD